MQDMRDATGVGTGLGIDSAKAGSAKQSTGVAPLSPAPWVVGLSQLVTNLVSLTSETVARKSFQFPNVQGLRAQLHDSSFDTVAFADLIKSLAFCGKLRKRATKPIVPVMCSARGVDATKDPENLKVVEMLATKAHPLTGGGPGLMEVVSRLDFMARLADLTCSFVEKHPERAHNLVEALMQRTTRVGERLVDSAMRCGIKSPNSGQAPRSRDEILAYVNGGGQFSPDRKAALELFALDLAMNSDHDMLTIRELLKDSCKLTDTQIAKLGLEVFAVKIHIPSEEILSRYISADTQLNYFFGRKLPFAKEGKVALVMPGGLGTYEELVELLQQGLDVVIYGKMWEPLVTRLKESPNPELRELANKHLHYCTSPEEVEQALDRLLPKEIEAGREPGETWFEEAYGDQAREFIAALLGTKEEIEIDARRLEEECMEALEGDSDAVLAVESEGTTHAAYWSRKFEVEGPQTPEAISKKLGKQHLKGEVSQALRKAHTLASKACALRAVSESRAQLLEYLEPDEEGKLKLDLRLLTWAIADMTVASSVQSLIPERNGVAVVGSRASYATYKKPGVTDPGLVIESQRHKTSLVESFGEAFGSCTNTFVIPNARPDSAPAMFIRSCYRARNGVAPHFIEITSGSKADSSVDRAIGLIEHPMVAVHSQFAKELAITKSTKGALFFEGGVNTEALFIEILDGIATGKIPRSYRMVLVGKEWGQGVLDCIDPLIKAKLADSYPLESILVTEDPEEAAAFLGLTKAGEETGGGPSAYGDLKRPQAPA